MQKPFRVVLGAGVGVLALTLAAGLFGPSVYRALFVPTPASAPSLSAGATMLDKSSTPLDPAMLAGDWDVAVSSEAGYRVEEVLSGENVSVTGRTEAVAGSFTITPDGLTLEAASLEVDVASISTGVAQRDSYFRDQALRSDQFPKATFVLTAPVSLGSVPNSGDVVKTDATGDLTLAGITQRVTATVEVRSDGLTAEIVGSIPITFADYGVEAPSLGFVKVAPEGAVEFTLTATPH